MTMRMPQEPIRPLSIPYAEIPPADRVVMDLMIDQLLKRGHLTKILLEQGHELEPGYSRKAVIDLLNMGMIRIWTDGDDQVGWLIYHPTEHRYGFLLPPEDWKG